MKEAILSLAQYHLWANNLMFQSLLHLEESLLKKEVTSSFPSLHATLLHVWDAESAWWQRIKLAERVVKPSEGFEGDAKDVIAGLQQVDRQLLDWVTVSPERALLHEMIYMSFKKEQFKQPVYEVLLHVFNHATYHRGQMVTMLRELGVTTIPATDYVVWTRVKR